MIVFITERALGVHIVLRNMQRLQNNTRIAQLSGVLIRNYIPKNTIGCNYLAVLKMPDFGTYVHTVKLFLHNLHELNN